MFERDKLSYEIQYAKAADKFLKKHENIRTQYESAIRELFVGNCPEKVDVKRIKGKHNNYFRIRLGDYRVVYTIIKDKIIVVVTLVAGNRGDVYKKTNGLK